MDQVLDRKDNKPLSTDISISICNHWSTGAMGEAPHPSGAPLVRSRLLADEITVVTHALRQHAVVYILGHSHVRVPQLPTGWRGALAIPGRYLLEMPYKVHAAAF